MEEEYDDDWEDDDTSSSVPNDQAQLTSKEASWDTVKHLHMPRHALAGSLPKELALLTDVESIDLR